MDGDEAVVGEEHRADRDGEAVQLLHLRGEPAERVGHLGQRFARSRAPDLHVALLIGRAPFIVDEEVEAVVAVVQPGLGRLWGLGRRAVGHGVEELCNACHFIF